MVDREVVEKKLQELKGYVTELEQLKKFSFEEIVSSLSRAWSIEHGLQITIQIVIDIGNHILASVGENEIDEYVDIIDKLGEKNVIPLSFAKKIRDMAGFRNILVHEYTRVDLKQVYEILQERLGDFLEFTRHIKNYLKT
ncbi:MAG: DUF86 domain-containing protein [Candidatus Omnitrophota bacterium]